MAIYIVLKYKKRLLLRCFHHFKSDLISYMDNMCISGIEPSSVILSQTKWFQKLTSDAVKVPKQTEAKRDGVKTHKITNSISGKFRCSQIATNQSKSTVELGYMCPRGLAGPPAVTLTK